MTYPNFFNDIEKITLQDKLANFLGATANGIIEFNYIDVVKTAGHSCPTVLGAYLMTREALTALYENETPIRGEIKVEFAQESIEGVTGVISNVITNITGATKDTGFKGLNGNHNRNDLMHFAQNISSNVRFTRVDTNKSVDIFYNPNLIPANEQMQELMALCMQNKATLEQKEEFANLWQERVKNIALNVNKVIKIEHL